MSIQQPSTTTGVFSRLKRSSSLVSPPEWWNSLREKLDSADEMLTFQRYLEAKIVFQEVLKEIEAAKDQDNHHHEPVAKKYMNQLRSCAECSLGVALGKLCKHDLALAAFSRALEAWPSNPEAWNARAMFYLELPNEKHYTLALRDINECVRLEPQSSVCLANRAAIHLQAGNFEIAERDCEQAISLDADAVAPLANLAVVMAATDRADLAITNATQAIDANPSNASLYSLRAGIFAGASRLQEALADMANALRLEPGNIALIMMRAGLYAKCGDWQACADDYSKALPLVEARLGLAGAHRNLRCWNKAIADYTALLQDLSDPTITLGIRAQALAQRAQIHLHTQAIEQAILDARECLGLTDPDIKRAEYEEDEVSVADQDAITASRFEAYSCLALVHLFAERYQDACDNFTRALQLEPDDFSALANRAVCFMEKGDMEKCIEDCDRALSIQPNSAECLRIRARSHLRLGSLDRALEDAESTVRIDPTSSQSFFTRAQVRAGSGSYELAIADCEKAMELDPENGFIRRVRDDALKYVTRTNQGRPSKRRRSTRTKTAVVEQDENVDGNANENVGETGDSDDPKKKKMAPITDLNSTDANEGVEVIS